MPTINEHLVQELDGVLQSAVNEMAHEAVLAAYCRDGEPPDDPDVLVQAIREAATSLRVGWLLVAEGVRTSVQPGDLCWLGLDPREHMTHMTELTAVAVALMDRLFEHEER